jgi:hypothetical protein
MVWPENHWDVFSHFDLKTGGDGLFWFDLKIDGFGFFSLDIKTDSSGLMI